MSSKERIFLVKFKKSLGFTQLEEAFAKYKRRRLDDEFKPAKPSHARPVAIMHGGRYLEFGSVLEASKWVGRTTRWVKRNRLTTGE